MCALHLIGQFCQYCWNFILDCRQGCVFTTTSLSSHNKDINTLMDDHVIRFVSIPTETEPVRNRSRSDEIMNKSNDNSLKIVADHVNSKVRTE